MVLSNASKRARYASTISVQNQGGGNKKIGLPYQIGRTAWTNIYFGTDNNGTFTRRLCKRTDYMTMTMTSNISRNIGYTGNAPYWHIRGT